MTRARCTTRSGTTTSSTPRKTAPPSSTSTATWSTKSPARRRSKGCAWPGARSGACQLDRGRQPTTTCPPPAGRGYDGIADPISQAAGRRRSTPTAMRLGAAAYFQFLDKRQGIVHVIGPEQGATLPGMTVVCGDSHTSHARRLRRAGARHRHQRGRARAGDADAAGQEGEEHAGQGRRQAARAAAAPRTSCWRSSAGSAPPAAPATRSSSPARRSARSRMEGRMTVCNMAIEAGARAGLVGVDDTTIDYVQGPAVRTDRRGMGAGRALLAHAALRRRRALRRAWSSSTPRGSSRRSPGAPRRRWCWRSTTACPTPRTRRTPASATRSSAR